MERKEEVKKSNNDKKKERMESKAGNKIRKGREKKRK
jgi:hypothetical protein